MRPSSNGYSFPTGRPKNRTPRNMFIANLCLSGLVMTLICIPTTFMQILYGGWWHLGLVACKLVPAIQGKEGSSYHPHSWPLSVIIMLYICETLPKRSWICSQCEVQNAHFFLQICSWSIGWTDGHIFLMGQTYSGAVSKAFLIQYMVDLWPILSGYGILKLRFI